jgi:UPF0755 protein
MEVRKRTRRRSTSRPPKSARRTPPSQGAARKAPPRRGRRGLWVSLGGIGVVFVLLLAFAGWARGTGPGGGMRTLFEVDSTPSTGELAERLKAAGMVRSALAFSWYLRLTGSNVEQGPHVLRDDLSPRELAQRLTRSPARPIVRVTIPEGYHHRQIADRLAELEVCTAQDFRAAVFDPELLRELALRGPSAEGFLFPATYEFFVDSDPSALVRQLVAEARKRLARVEARQPGALAALAKRDGFDEHDVFTLASIVEREAADRAEQPLIASVFYNRLRDATFRPLKALESDPTAAYGCLVEPTLAPSCAGFHGQVTPALLRDAKNRYNTYRHGGLPPGPIANPGESALAAVLAPASSEYLFFVASGRGKHAFSRTFDEHRRAIAR